MHMQDGIDVVAPCGENWTAALREGLYCKHGTEVFHCGLVVS